MLPDLSIFWVVFFVLVLTGVLNQLLFKPLQRVMGEATTGSLSPSGRSGEIVTPQLCVAGAVASRAQRHRAKR